MKKHFLLVAAIFVFTAIQAQACNDRTILGRVEYANLRKLGGHDDIKYKARIDSGAGLSSIDARIIEVKTNPERVVFEIFDENGKTVQLERKIVDWVNIKKKGSDGFIKRPMVNLSICLGGKKIKSRVNLADRSEFIYPLLIGRNTLKAGDFLIDPDKIYAQEHSCD